MERTSISPETSAVVPGRRKSKAATFEYYWPSTWGKKAMHNKTENECFLSLKILSPSHIQQIRLRERFKKILTLTKKKRRRNFWATGSGGRGRAVGEGGREQFVIHWLQAIHHRNWVSNAASSESLLPCQRFNTLHWECKSCWKFGTNYTAPCCTPPARCAARVRAHGSNMCTHAHTCAASCKCTRQSLEAEHPSCPVGIHRASTLA